MLSKPARALLRHASRHQVEVTPENLEAYRELARAGIMEPFNGFMRGPEAVFRFTEFGWKQREQLQRSRFALSAIARRILRALWPIGKSVSGAR